MSVDGLDVDVGKAVHTGVGVLSVLFGWEVAAGALFLGLLLLMAGCESSSFITVQRSQPWGSWWGAVGTDVPANGPEIRPVAAPVPALAPLKPTGSAGLVVAAMAWLGVPYEFGGCDRLGIDCSCMVMLAARANGYSIPRTTVTQIAQLPAVSEPLAGDLLYFNNTCTGCGANPTHVGMALGDGRMIHAGDPVHIESYQTPFWQSRIAGYRRIV